MSSQNWRNVTANFVGIVTPTMFGPFDLSIEGVLVQQGSGPQLYILSEPFEDLAQLASSGDFTFVQEIGIQLNANGLFLPARFDRFWLMSGVAIANTTILTVFWDINVPPTR